MGLDAGGPDAVCPPHTYESVMVLRLNMRWIGYLFGVGRPRPIWGWLDAPEKAGEGSRFVCIRWAMLIQRRAFLDVGGFDASFFAYSKT